MKLIKNMKIYSPTTLFDLAKTRLRGWLFLFLYLVSSNALACVDSEFSVEGELIKSHKGLFVSFSLSNNSSKEIEVYESFLSVSATSLTFYIEGKKIDVRGVGFIEDHPKGKIKINPGEIFSYRDYLSLYSRYPSLKGVLEKNNLVLKWNSRMLETELLNCMCKGEIHIESTN